MCERFRIAHQKYNLFLHQQRSDSPPGDDSLLVEACNEIEKTLTNGILPKKVHLADNIYKYMGQEGLVKRVSLHRMYLETETDLDERFWSHWQLVDSLAVLGKHREAVEEQSVFYQWTSTHLTAEHIVRALEDTTQAQCWKHEGRIEEWIELYKNNSKLIQGPDVSRKWKCLFLRAGASVYIDNDKLEYALIELDKLEVLNNEVPDWKHFRVHWLALITSRLQIHGKRKEWRAFNEVAMEACSYVESEVADLNSKNESDIESLSWVAHDVGACMMWAKRYTDAERLFQIAIDTKPNAWSHYFMSVCLWASGHNRPKTLHHLRSAQDFTLNPLNRGRFYQVFLETPEFTSVRNDCEFLRVFDLA